MALIENRVNEQLEAGQRFIEQKVGISYESQEEMIKEQTNGKSPIHSIAARLIGSFTKLMVNGLLVLIYLFLFIYYRTRFTTFVLTLALGDDRERVHAVINWSSRVAQPSLMGRGGLMIHLQ